jgi:hypothetical protein
MVQNSLDVPTNSVAQVAAAIEERRSARTAGHARSSSRPERKPSKALQGRAFNAPRMALQGRAFNAPRMASMERSRQLEQTIEQLTQELDTSPRKALTTIRRRRSGSQLFKTPPSNRKGRIIEEKTANELRRQFGHHTRGLSHSSNITNRSKATPGGHADSSALRFYLQHEKDKPYAPSYAGSLKPASLASSFETRKKRWLNEQWRPQWGGHRQSRSLA